MSIETIKVESEQTPLDLLIWRRFKREVPGLVEDTLRRNPNLARRGVLLPLGLEILVKTPEPEPRGRAAIPVISLYD